MLAVTSKVGHVELQLQYHRPIKRFSNYKPLCVPKVPVQGLLERLGPLGGRHGADGWRNAGNCSDSV